MRINKFVPVWALLALLFCNNSYAQQKNTALKASGFQSVTTVGIVSGNGGGALQLLTVNGIRHRLWFWGLGVGVDDYRLRSVPVFFEVRKVVYKGFFAYTDVGANWYWNRAGDPRQYYNNDKIRGGFYGEAGIGYAIKLRRNTALQFGGGYSYKKLTETGYNFVQDPIGFPGAPLDEKINYNLKRIALKIGVVF